MPEFNFYSGSAIKAARIFIIRYGSSPGNLDQEANVSEAPLRPLLHCMESLDLSAQGIRRRHLLTKHKDLEVASYDHLPMTVPAEEAQGFLGVLLQLAQHYDEFIQAIDSAWIAGVIPRKERSVLIRHWEGRIFNTAARCWKAWDANKDVLKLDPDGISEFQA